MTSPSRFRSFLASFFRSVRRPPCQILIVAVFVRSLCPGLIAADGGVPADKKQTKPYALIFGTVWGPDDRPVYGVKVKIRKQDEKKVRWELYSDRRGEFAQRVPAGKADYVVWPDLKGSKLPEGRKLEGQEVTVHVDYDERVDTGLRLK